MTGLIHEPESRAATAGTPGLPVLWQDFHLGRDRLMRDRLVMHYAPLVHHVASRVGTGLPAHVELADLEQSGVFGLIDAIERYQPERGPRFETYAMPRIRGVIIDELRAQDWVPRTVRGRVREFERAQERLEGGLQRAASESELAGELGIAQAELRAGLHHMHVVSMEALAERVGVAPGANIVVDAVSADADCDPASVVETRENSRTLARALDELDERDRRILRLYYFQGRTLAEIGAVLGVTESRVCQLHARAVVRLRSRFEALATG